MEEKKFNTGELTLNYAEGPDNGAPMVLLHGTGRWWHDWERMTPRLEQHYHVYAVDLRGHGSSDRSTEPYTLTNYARDIVAFLRDVVKAPAVLLGTSIGGVIAVVVAAQAPELVRTLVPIEAPIGSADPSFKPESKGRFAMQRDMVLNSPTFDDMLAKVIQLRQGRDDGLNIPMARCMYSVDPAAYNSIIDGHLFDGLDNLDSLLDRISAPTLVFVGDWARNGSMRPEDIERMRKHIPGLKVIEFPGSDHNLPTVKADELIDGIQAFLQPTS
jgi:pimeloyl-ACP methyl ester carboxylesterase